MFLVILDLQCEWEGLGKEGKQAELWKRSRWLIYHFHRGSIGDLVFFGEQRGAIGVKMLRNTQESPTFVGLNASNTLHRP